MILPSAPVLPTLSGLAAQTAAFRSALAPADVATIELARNVFQASWIVFSAFGGIVFYQEMHCFTLYDKDSSI